MHVKFVFRESLTKFCLYLITEIFFFNDFSIFNYKDFVMRYALQKEKKKRLLIISQVCSYISLTIATGSDWTLAKLLIF